METQISRPESVRPPMPAKKSASSPDTIPCTDPATLESLGNIPVTSPDEVKHAVEQARKAQALWAGTPFSERRRVLARLSDYLLDHAEDLCQTIARDSGKTRENALMGEIWPICEKIRHIIATGEDDLKPEHVSSGLLMHKRSTIEFHPLGVIGVICPWNFPLQNILGPVIPALMAGNAVVVKVSEWTSWSVPRFREVFDAVFGATGYPKDLVQIITGYAETGQALIAAGCGKIVFTGSMPNGKRVMAECAKNLTPVILELGGKDPMIVCDDAELERAAHAALTGTFMASGQMCLAAERIYVFDAIYDQFVARVTELAGQLRQGPPLTGEVVDVGAMTMPAQLDVVERLVNDAVAKGARLLVGGKRRPELGGQFFAPTVLADVNHSMSIVHDETFGPVMSILRVHNEDEAVRLSNETGYGLGSCVFTRSRERGRRIAQRIISGATIVNDFGTAYMANALPFGGVGGSGFGRLNGRQGIRELTNIKAFMEDRFSISTGPLKLYPVKSDDFQTTRATLELLYRKGLIERGRGAFDLVRRLSVRFFG